MNKSHAFIGTPPALECLLFAAVYFPFVVAAALFDGIPQEVYAFASVLGVACWISAALRSGMPSGVLLLAALVALLLDADSASLLLSSAAALAVVLRVLGIMMLVDRGRSSA